MSKPPVRITRRQARAQINHFGWPLALYMILFSLLRYGTVFLSKYSGKADPELFLLLSSIGVYLFMALIPFTIGAYFLRLDIRDYMHSPRLRIDRSLGLICIGIGIYLIVMSVSTLFYFFFHTQATGYAFIGQWCTPMSILKNILYFFLLVIIQPLCEEYIFRGIIQRQLGHYGRYFGVLGSAFLYMLVQMDMAQAVQAFIIGWYLSLITLRYHSIRLAITVHIALSLFLWILESMSGNFLWLVTIFMILVYIGATLFILQWRSDTSKIRYGATEGKLWRILLSSFSIRLCVVLFIVNIILSFQ
mgnify:CR=1 FL=1